MSSTTISDAEKAKHAEAFQRQIEIELNTISWTQIPATDLHRVQKFYAEVFGWQYDNLSAGDCIQDSVQESAYKELNLAPSDAMFVMFRFSANDPVPHGGFVKVTEENLLSPAVHKDNAKKARLSVCSTITVRSCDDTLKKVVEAGGEVYQEKMLIPGGMGATALFLDTEKNVMGLWSEK